VITTVHVPVVPEVNFPAAAPPTVAEFEHPLAVNLVPADRMPAEKINVPFASKLPRKVVFVAKAKVFVADL
jgi:hypothetical protein